MHFVDAFGSLQKVLDLHTRMPPKKLIERGKDALTLPLQASFNSYPYLFMRRQLRNDNILKWTAFK